ncbi:MAG: CNP1-like family protein [Burkholderiaceae bacterium]
MLLAGALSLLAASPATALLFDDDKHQAEVDWPDPPPAPPNLDRLVEYSLIEGRSDLRFAFDPDSLVAVDQTGVRLTLVVTSRSGTPNISHEAFRCTSLERKMLATGHRDGHWSPVARPEWKKLDAHDNATQWLKPLYLAICDGGEPTTRVDTIKRRLNALTQIPN